MLEFLRDHVYWRRNFHPEDPPAIPTQAAQQPAFQEFEARLRRELHTLSALLKRSVPFHSPRYLGHMVSDLLIPGLAAQMLALPYNPNNVSDEAAPVTIDLEIKVGLQLARLFGFPCDPQQENCAFGHLTSGGTLANFQALRLALALKCLPVTLRTIAPPELSVSDSDYEAFNRPPHQAIELLIAWQQWLAGLSSGERIHWQQRFESERIEQLGSVRFFAQHPALSPPVVMAPVTAHYSWSKGMKLLGLGREQLILVPESGMRLDMDAFDQILRELRASKRSVLLAVAVLGTTEFGTIDPIHELVALRERYVAEGYGFTLHVDAAWGGYLATLFRKEDGQLRSFEEIRDEFTHFPNPCTYAAMAALKQVDSITVDPHKLGYLAFGTGAFVYRDHRAMELLTETADYVFTDATTPGYFNRYRKLGRYILEGSKSGAAAAAVYVTHRVLPLDHQHFGQITRQTIRSTEAFVVRAEQFTRDIAARLRVCMPYLPDTNLVCLAINPTGNRDVAVANTFIRKLHDVLGTDPSIPLQSREFFCSTTTLRTQTLGEQDMHRILTILGLDPASMQDNDPQSDRLLILRHTLMNPFHLDAENDISYIDGYFEYLSHHLDGLLPTDPPTFVN